MIKIIKEGKKPIKTKRVYRGKCPKCGCEFEFEDEDCNILQEKCLNGKAILTVKCPYCDEIITTDLNSDDAFEYEDRPVEEEKPYDIMTDNDTWKIHPEQDLRYYNVHNDKYNPPFTIDEWPNTISRINSIDNYKLPDDYKTEDFDDKNNLIK